MTKRPDFFDDDDEERESIQDILERSLDDDSDQEMNPDRDFTFEGTDFDDEEMFGLFDDEDDYER